MLILTNILSSLSKRGFFYPRPPQLPPIGYRPNITLRNTFFFFPDKQNQMLINRNLVGRDVLLISEITAGSS